MSGDTYEAGNSRPRKGFSGRQVVVFMLLAVLVTAALTFWVARTYLFRTSFNPVELSQREEAKLEGKLQALGWQGRLQDPADGQLLEPVPYSESDADREVSLTEKELNGLLARNTDMANRIAVDLANDLASAQMLLPVPPDFPFLGGKTLRMSAGLELAYNNERPVIVLKGLSVMGVPLPNAWMGNLKNVDLVQEFGGNAGFWRSFAAGIEHIEVRDGRLHIKLNE